MTGLTQAHEEKLTELTAAVITNLYDAELVYNEEPSLSRHPAHLRVVSLGFASVMMGHGGGFNPSFMQEAIDATIEACHEAYEETHGIKWSKATEDFALTQEAAFEWEQEWLTNNDQDNVTYKAVGEVIEGDEVRLTIENSHAPEDKSVAFPLKTLIALTDIEILEIADKLLDGFLEGAGGGYRLHRDVTQELTFITLTKETDK